MNAQDGDTAGVTYRLKFDSDRKPKSFLVDSGTGNMLFKVEAADILDTPDKRYNVTLEAVDCALFDECA